MLYFLAELQCHDLPHYAESLPTAERFQKDQRSRSLTGGLHKSESQRLLETDTGSSSNLQHPPLSHNVKQSVSGKMAQVGHNLFVSMMYLQEHNHGSIN